MEVVLVAGATAKVTVDLDESVVATRDWATANHDFLAVVSSTIAGKRGLGLSGWAPPDVSVSWDR